MEARQLTDLTIAEYLALEQEMDTRYEYHAGRVFAMAGGTLEHGLITGNAFGEIRSLLRAEGSDCKPINNDVKLHIESANKFLYPDVMVVCGDIERSDREASAVINPVLIIEVLSRSTESYDRGDKFFAYRQIDTLQEYVLVDQYQALVDVYQRQGQLWKITRTEGLSTSITLRSIGITLPLASLYEDVVFVTPTS
ncbi:MAG: Uma2 family endonuclease [Lewinella sp.]|nr:Uma2 family endonuclease [Lewinella sp.]